MASRNENELKYTITINEDMWHDKAAVVEWEDGKFQTIHLNPGDAELIENGADPVADGWEDGEGNIVDYINAHYVFALCEFDGNDREITDNDGAPNYDEAVKSAIHMCENGRAKVVIANCEDLFPVATVVAPSADDWALRQYHHDTLRMAMFGDDSLSYYEDDLDDRDRFIRWALDQLDDNGGFVVSDKPVVFECDDDVPVYTTWAVTSALIDVFEFEVQAYREEQEAE